MAGWETAVVARSAAAEAQGASVASVAVASTLRPRMGLEAAVGP